MQLLHNAGEQWLLVGCAVRVVAHDRAGLDRLLRYCARPPFALDRLELLDAEPADYQLPKRRRNRAAALILPQEMRKG